MKELFTVILLLYFSLACLFVGAIGLFGLGLFVAFLFDKLLQRISAISESRGKH